ncbi:hypothetical protein FN976_10955 [Caenimonas sedimenti]|uniref:Type II secretion system protein GspF domain-containing protein n=1 Tax=Caenimonas sedimenti TaxID=2596921 RepID=A0A562ZS59_9BURK|nr:type II secretion system F family protein [Caenimonas sedimenti]TWO71429.1 hypothetical protein FN976_10955 [Caenimonas sedimenti]
MAQAGSLTLLERLSIGGDDRVDFYKAMAKSADDGLPQVEVLKRIVVEHRKTKHVLTPVIAELLRRLGGGPRPGAPDYRTFGTELEGLVPPSEALLVQAGESSGQLAEGFRNAAGFVESNGKLLKVVMAELSKPLLYLSALIVLLIYFSVKVLPKFEASRPRVNWPSHAQMLGTVADNIGLIAFATAAFVAGIAAALAWATPNWIGDRREFCDRRVFPFTLIASIQGASLLVALSGYIGAGIPFADAIKNISSGGSRYMRFQCNRVTVALKHGKTPSEALTLLSIIQARYHWIFSVYGLSRDAKLAYKTIAEQMVERTQAFIKVVFGRYVNNVMLIVLGAAIGWIYLSVLGIAAPANVPGA